MYFEPVRRKDEDMKSFKKKWGFKPRRIDRGRLGCIHPSPSSTPPAVVAAWTSLVLFGFSGAWFAVSTVGYGLIFKFSQPLPRGETMNIERIFDTFPINRWAVNVVMSWFTCFFMLIQTFFLVAYRMDRRVKRDFARQVRMGLAVQSAADDQDNWDQEELDLAEAQRAATAHERRQYIKEATKESSKDEAMDDSIGFPVERPPRTRTAAPSGGYGTEGQAPAYTAQARRDNRSTGRDRRAPRSNTDFDRKATLDNY